jgi:regulator of protease activity HflC (stomatin/prohibitin superfamily)
MQGIPGFFLVALLIIAVFMFSGVRVLMEYERGVVFRFGRYLTTRQAGLRWIIPMVDRMVKISLRVFAMDVPPQDVITKDNVSVKVNAVVYFRVVDPKAALIQIEDFFYATSQIAQTTLRSVLGQAELDELLSEREKINKLLQEILDKHTDAWGIKVSMVEVKHIDLPQEMQRAMARQAEAERERRAKVIAADGEFQAAQKLHDAAAIIGKEPVAIQLRYLQTLIEVAGDKNSTTIFPVPIDLLKGFVK